MNRTEQDRVKPEVFVESAHGMRHERVLSDQPPHSPVDTV
jgi:hypothetical protein